MIAETISIHTIKTTIIEITDIIRTTNAMIAGITGINTTNIMADVITGIHTIKAAIIETISIIDTIIAMITDQMATGHFI